MSTTPTRARTTHPAGSRRHRPAHDTGARGRHPSARPGPKRPPGDRSSTFLGLLVITSALVLLGLVMVMSAASVSDLRTSGSAWESFTRQAVFAFVGFVGMVLVMRRHYTTWRSLALPFLVVAFALLALVLVPGVGVGANGATRWLGAGSLRFQPSELAKLAMIVWSAHWLADARRHAAVHDDPRVLRPVLMVAGTAAALLLLQPNLGTLIIATVAVAVVVYLSGASLLRLAGWGALGLGVAAVAALGASYRRARVLAFLDPWADPANTGYQTIQSLVGIASGGLTGVGLGASRAKWGFLPYAHTDFIFAIIAEELGLIGALTVLALFVALGLFGVRAALRAPDTFGMLLAAGITTWFVVQALVNIGAVVGLLPITGVPLPFVSYGGTSLVVNLLAMGVLLSVARQGRMPDTWAIVAGGGTAGHTLPGLAVAQALVARGHPAAEVHFVGSERGTEVRLVPAAGFSLTALPGRGIQRRLALENLAAVAGLVRAFAEALGLVRRRRPSVVLALGGYASVACALAAALHRVPIVVAEQNAVPGAANRLVARFAKAAAVSFPGTDLPRAVVTGNPVRQEVLAVDRAHDRGTARKARGLPADRTVLLAFGGSLGARRINRALVALVGRWQDRRDLAIHHVVGERDWEDPTARGEERTGEDGILYRPVRYEDDMPTVLAAADIVLARAGATTVAELAVVGLPSVLVPLPIATADHQTANARALVDRGAARLVPDAELDADRLAAELTPLLDDPAALAAMGAAAHEAGRPDAAERVADLVEEHARG